ncbi:MAG: CAF17-like 4Fe-4S cluster assembly/insertion protein YgfZ, partial [Myxococcaceae bacterium]
MDERTIPLEAGLQRALHYQKGCYIGQEVIARATFRGHVNRKLVGLHFGAGATPAPRVELFAGDRRVGWVTSVVHSPRFGPIGLGYAHRDVSGPGTELTLAGGAGSARVEALPFAG